MSKKKTRTESMIKMTPLKFSSKVGRKVEKIITMSHNSDTKDINSITIYGTGNLLSPKKKINHKEVAIGVCSMSDFEDDTIHSARIVNAASN